MISIYQLIAWIALCCGSGRKKDDAHRVPYIPDVDYIHYHNGDDPENDWVVEDWYGAGIK